MFCYHSPETWLEVFRTYYGPILKAFAAIEPSARVELAQDLTALAAQFNRADDGTMVVPSAYLEAVIA